MNKYFSLLKNTFVLPLGIFIVVCLSLGWIELKTADKMKQIIVIPFASPQKDDAQSFYKRQFDFYRNDNWPTDNLRFSKIEFSKGNIHFTEPDLVNLTYYLGTQIRSTSKYVQVLGIVTEEFARVNAPSYELKFNIALNYYKKNQFALAQRTIDLIDDSQMRRRNPLLKIATLTKLGEFKKVHALLVKSSKSTDVLAEMMATVLRVVSPSLSESTTSGFDRILEFKNEFFSETDWAVEVEFANYQRRCGRLQEAEAIIAKIVQDPDSPGKANQVYAQILLQTDRELDAINELKRALAKNPENTDVRERLHDLYFRKRDFFSARTQSLRLVEMAPGNPEYILLLGRDELRVNNAAEAVKQFQLAIEKSGGNWSEPWLKLSEAQLELGQYEAALKSAQDALKVGPDDPDVYIALSKIYVALKDNKRSLKILEEGAKKNPSKEAFWKRLGDAYADEKQLLKAKESYLKAISLDAKYANALVRLAGIEFDSGNFIDAIRYYTVAIEERPSSAKLLFERARAYSKLGQLGRALNDYQKAFDLSDTENIVFRAKVMRRISSLYRKTQKLNDALAAAERSVDLDSEEYFGYLELTDSQIALGNLDGAKKSIRIALKLNSESCAVLRRAKKLKIPDVGGTDKCKNNESVEAQSE